MKNLSFFLYIFLLVNIISKPKTRRTSVTHHKKNNPPPNNEPPKEQPKKEEPQKNEQVKIEQKKIEEEKNQKQNQNQNQQSIKNDLNKKNDTDNKKIIPEKKEFNLTEEVEKDAIKKQNDVHYQAKVTKKQYKKKSKKEQ